MEIMARQGHLFCDGVYEAGSSRFREIEVAKVNTDDKVIGGRILVEHFEKNPT
jgi:hypothetical protein